MGNKKIIIFVGPSGSGKTSIGQVLEKKGIPRLVTTTTRKARSGEVDGIDYYFQDFSKLDIEKFIEQTIYNNNRYGLTKNEVESMLETHDIVHVSLDQQGAEVLVEKYPDEAFVVFVQITEAEMIERMKKRGDSEKQITERVKYCRQTEELLPPKQTDLIIRNIDLEESAQIILNQLSKKNKDNA